MPILNTTDRRRSDTCADCQLSLRDARVTASTAEDLPED